MGQDSGVEFGGLLRRLRLAEGFSQEALAERAGLSVDAVAALERGRRQRPRPVTVRLLADALSLDEPHRLVLIEASTAARALSPEVTPNTATVLPAPLTSFVGRDRELRELRHQLQTARLLTLNGTGGIGKTRLAIEVAARWAQETGNPAWFVALDSRHDPELVPQTVAAALGMRDQRGRAPLDTLLRWLRAARGLVVMDNCEHLVGAVAAVVQALLLECPHIRVLATSRTVLGVPGEATWRVPSLQLPDPGSAPDLAALGRVEAVRLFVERATLADPAFRLSEHNAEPVAGICRWLEGIPLAIELAAARARVLAPSQMLTRLEDAHGLLTGGSVMAAARHRTLHATIEWSYELLEPAERTVFAMLSVFSGGFQLEAAEAVAGYDVLELVTGLVDHSLVIAAPNSVGEMRYRVLEVLRQFGRARLKESGALQHALLRHALYYADFAELAEAELMGPNQIRWMGLLRHERENLRAALAWSLRAAGATDDPGDRLRIGLRLAAELWYFWYADGALVEGRRWLEGLSSRQDALPPGQQSSALKARALAGAAWLAYVQSHHQAATSLAESSLRLIGREEEPAPCVNAWSTLGAVALETQHFNRAAELFRKALDLARRTGLEWWIGASLNNLAFLAYRTGDLSNAGRLIEEAADGQRARGDARGLAASLLNLGAIRFEQGDASSALSHYLESLRLLQRLGSTPLTAELLEDLAGVLLAQGHAEVSVRVLSSAVAYRDAIGAPTLEWREPGIDRVVANLRERLGPKVHEIAWSAGQTLSIDEAVADVLRIPDSEP